MMIKPIFRRSHVDALRDFKQMRNFGRWSMNFMFPYFEIYEPFELCVHVRHGDSATENNTDQFDTLRSSNMAGQSTLVTDDFPMIFPLIFPLKMVIFPLKTDDFPMIKSISTGNSMVVPIYFPHGFSQQPHGFMGRHLPSAFRKESHPSDIRMC